MVAAALTEAVSVLFMQQLGKRDRPAGEEEAGDGAESKRLRAEEQVPSFALSFFLAR